MFVYGMINVFYGINYAPNYWPKTATQNSNSDPSPLPVQGSTFGRQGAVAGSPAALRVVAIFLRKYVHTHGKQRKHLKTINQNMYKEIR